MDHQQFETRKKDHIRQALLPQHQAGGLSGLDAVRLEHEALPDLNFEEVSLKAPFLDRPLSTPFFVSGMTAGHADAFEINRRLARVARARGWAMGVGSQRRDLEAFGSASADGGVIDQWKAFRQEFPDLVLFSNLGLSQLVGASLEAVRKVMDVLDADLLMIHLNALQEALQPEGTPQFKDGFKALERLVRQLGRPVGVKETGCGMSPATLRRLRDLGLAAVDVSGLGGTHWGRIEGARGGENTPQARAAQVFAHWGNPTVDSVRDARTALGDTESEIWASGGVRNGLDAAKCIALGAHRVGYAKPALEAVLVGEEQLDTWMAQQEFELRVALFCTGRATVADLRHAPVREVSRG